MDLTEFSPAGFEQKLAQARQAIEDEDFPTALDLSQAISRDIESCSVSPVLETDGAVRPYSIIVVGYTPLADHQPMVDFLLSLEAARFEVIFVENAEGPVFPLPEGLAGRNLRVLRLGANLGVGIARNLGILSATGDGVILLDDDGLTDAQSIEALIDLFEKADAAVVRGRVQPKTVTEEPPQHYDPGDKIVQRFCDIEGMSIWRRSEIRRVQMFDPILFGHEGVDLTVRLYPHNGPDACLYQPQAVLRHDFFQDPDKLEAKMARYRKLDGYLLHKNEHYKEVLNVFHKAPKDLVAGALLRQRLKFVEARAAETSETGSVSFLTTCYNGAEFIPEFVDGLKAQTDPDFHLVFVDDGSSDGSADLLEKLLPEEIARTIIRSENQGRSAALNQAFEAAKSDICLIADVDDIPVPQRVEWTRTAFAMHPDAQMIGFMIFDVRSHARAARPFPKAPVPLSIRAVFGMPSPFPGFAFRKAGIAARFNTELTAGVDCDWMFRAMTEEGHDGYLVPLNITFYRTHDGQITSSKRHIQRATALRHIQKIHHRLLGAEADDAALELFAGWTPIENGEDFWQAHAYGMKLLQALSPESKPEPERLSQEIYGHLDALYIALLRHDRETLKRRVSSQETRLDSTLTALEGVYRSSSWKITKPIRGLGRLLRRS